MKNRHGDEELAALYFDEQIAPGLRVAGTPDAGVDYLRKSYVADAIVNAEAMQQIREHHALQIAERS